MPAVAEVATAFREAGTKILTAAREIARFDRRSSWVQRFIIGELCQRAKNRGPAYWDSLFPGLAQQERAQRRIVRMLTRATIAGVAGAGGATTAEVLSIWSDGSAVLFAAPIALVSVGAEMLYTTALQIDLAYDLASIYGVPFADDDVGEIATLLAMSLGVDLVTEPTRHDKPSAPGTTKPWRVVRQMQRRDFASDIGTKLLESSLLRNTIPIAGVVVSGVWHQVVLRRFARSVHVAVRERSALVRACRDLHLGQPESARKILDGAWLLATADGNLKHAEALALSTLIDTLALPERIAVNEASFADDEESWFEQLPMIDPSDRDKVVDVLALVAVSDGPLSIPERRFLLRVGRTLARDVDLSNIDRICAQLRAGQAPSRATAPSRQVAVA
jgi:tellurite resistance protein